MRFVIVVFMLCLGLKSWAFRYQVESAGTLRPSLVKAQQITRIMEQHGLWSLRGASLIQAGLPFDFAYVNNNWNKTILLKEGLKAPDSKMGVVFRDEKTDALLFHFQLDGSSYVAMALGFDVSEFQTVVAPLRPKPAYSKWSLLLSPAYAMDTDCGLRSSPGHQVLAASTAGLDDGALLRTIGKCGTDALQGVRQSAEGTLDFFNKLATDPSALWSEMKHSFLQLKEFTQNMKAEMQGLFKQLQNMPSQQKMQIACTMTGELLGGVAQGLLAAGSIAKTMPLLLAKMRASMSLLSKLAELKKQGYKTPDLNLATKEILSCAN